MSSWGDEIEAAVNPGVRDPLLSGDVDLLLQELLILLIDVFEDGIPAGETGCVRIRETINSLLVLSRICLLCSQVFKCVASLVELAPRCPTYLRLFWEPTNFRY